jgi:hypothetical protein
MPLNYHGLTFENTLAGGQGWAYFDSTQHPYDPSSGVERIYNTTPSGTRDNNNRIWFNQDVTFLGLWMAGYNEGQQIIGYVGGVPTFSTTALPSDHQPFGLLFNLNWPGVDGISVTDLPVGGINDYYVLDDIRYDVVPEATTTIALLAVVMLLLEGVRRRLVPAPERKPARLRVRR